MDTLLSFERRITSANVLFFDMDGTLIDSDYANFLAYEEAIQQVLGQVLELDSFYTSDQRFTRECLERTIPGLTSQHIVKVVQLKNTIYTKYISATKLNKLAWRILKKYSKTNDTVLVTNCREERAKKMLEYHGVFDNFGHKFFRNDSCGDKKNKKYRHALTTLNMDPSLVFAFENDANEIEAAISAGISAHNIYAL